jgi:hypothetical protein
LDQKLGSQISNTSTYFATCNFHIKVCIAFRKRVTLAQQLRTSPSLNCKLLKYLLLNSSLFFNTFNNWIVNEESFGLFSQPGNFFVVCLVVQADEI